MTLTNKIALINLMSQYTFLMSNALINRCQRTLSHLNQNEWGYLVAAPP